MQHTLKINTSKLIMLFCSVQSESYQVTCEHVIFGHVTNMLKNGFVYNLNSSIVNN